MVSVCLPSDALLQHLPSYLGFSYLTTTTKSLQSCPTLCDPIDGSPPGSTAPGILQTRTLEWVSISFSNAWKWKEKVKSLSRVQLLATPWTAAYQAPPSMGFSRQEYWSGVTSISLHGCSSKAQPLLLTLDKGYLLTATPSDLEHGIAPLGPPVPWWRDPVEVSRKLPQLEG